MLHFVGDCHGHWAGLQEFDRLLRERQIPGPNIIIQVGDFGWDPESLKAWKPLDIPVYAIDGNHDHHGNLSQVPQDEITEVLPNLFFVPRGMILELDGYKVGFAGGAGSVDGHWRRKGVNWWPDLEVLRQEQVARLFSEPVDILVTHTPPVSVIKANWPPLNLDHWNLPKGWRDPSADVVQELWNVQAVLHDGQYPPLFCGHMHSRVHQNGCQVLDINEIAQLPDQVTALRSGAI